MSMRYTCTILAPCLALYLGLSPLLASTSLQNNAVVQQRKTASDQISLNIRLADAMPVDRVTARINGTPVSLSSKTAYPSAQQTSAILFLIDTSDPARQQAVSQAANHIEQIIDAADTHVRFGLARFDTDLHLLSPLGSNSDQLINKARSLRAVGKTTELYRNTLVAIRALAKYPADRKFIFLLSDGLAEDRAYFHRDVAQSAIQNDISIYTLGYSGTVSRTVALQTLRRLSEDTGGQYISTQPGSFQIDPVVLRKMLENMDSGIQLIANFKTAFEAGIGGRQIMDISIESAGTSLLLSVPVKLPGAPRIPVTATSAAAQLSTGPSTSSPEQPVIIRHIPRETAVADYSTLLLLTISLLMLGLAVFLWLRLRTGQETTPQPGDSKDKEPYAWLERLDGDRHERYPINTTHVKIGRFRGNDIALHDPAVSRYHAEILFTDDGKFMVADVGSKNGILVNDKEVYESALHDNDILEIGDIRMRFTIQSDFAADMQNTLLFKTQFPAPGSTSH